LVLSPENEQELKPFTKAKDLPVDENLPVYFQPPPGLRYHMQQQADHREATPKSAVLDTTDRRRRAQVTPLNEPYPTKQINLTDISAAKKVVHEANCNPLPVKHSSNMNDEDARMRPKSAVNIRPGQPFAIGTNERRSNQITDNQGLILPSMKNAETHFISNQNHKLGYVDHHRSNLQPQGERVQLSSTKKAAQSFETDDIAQNRKNEQAASQQSFIVSDRRKLYNHNRIASDVTALYEVNPKNQRNDDQEDHVECLFRYDREEAPVPRPPEIPPKRQNSRLFQGQEPSDQGNISRSSSRRAMRNIQQKQQSPYNIITGL
jgi:hypothetical protein